jgi:hypothetical protein
MSCCLNDYELSTINYQLSTINYSKFGQIALLSNRFPEHKGELMADKRKAKAQEDANRIAEWLVQNRAEFEQGGIGLAKLTESVGLPETDIRLALDHLENREEIVRWPQALLKPGRIWPQTRDKVLAKSQ